MRFCTRLLASVTALLLPVSAHALKIPPADMNGWVFQLPAGVGQFDVAIHGTLNADAYRDMGNYPAQYIVGDLPENYARAVVESLFRERTFSPAGRPPPAGSAVLQLVSVTTVHLWGKGMATRDMTDEVTAQWELRDPAGRVLHEFVFKGVATSPSGLGKAYGPRGRERTGLAHQDLLEKTVRGLAASVELQRFALLSELHLQPERSHEHARAKIAAAGDAGRNALLQAMLILAVDRGDFELYSTAQGEVDARNIAELQDESGLLHAVLATGDERLFTSVVSSSSNLDVEERDATPLGRLLLMGRDARALALVSAGASPVARIPGDAFAAAELNFHLAGLLAGDNANSRAAYAAARAEYHTAIADAERSIEMNEAEIWAAKWANIIAPVLQGAIAATTAQAQAGAISRQYGTVGFATVIYSPAHFDITTPKGAIEYLEDRIRHCREQLARIPE